MWKANGFAQFINLICGRLKVDSKKKWLISKLQKKTLNFEFSFSHLWRCFDTKVKSFNNGRFFPISVNFLPTVGVGRENIANRHLTPVLLNYVGMKKGSSENRVKIIKSTMYVNTIT